MLLFAHQDSRVDPFGWQSMVALLSLWEHAGMERLQMNVASEWNIFRHIKTTNQSKICDGYAGYTIIKLCANQATKNVLVDRSPEPLATHLNGEKKNGWNIETKHDQTISTTPHPTPPPPKKKMCEMAKRQLSVQTETKYLVLSQVIQSANRASSRRLKMYGWIALLSLL